MKTIDLNNTFSVDKLFSLKIYFIVAPINTHLFRTYQIKLSQDYT